MWSIIGFSIKAHKHLSEKPLPRFLVPLGSTTVQMKRGGHDEGLGVQDKNIRKKKKQKFRSIIYTEIVSSKLNTSIRV